MNTMNQDSGNGTSPYARIGSIKRITRETTIACTVNLDGIPQGKIKSGIPFFDHMLTSLELYAEIELGLTCNVDLEIDDHHTVEDCALAIGQAFDSALGSRAGIERFGFACVPMDETLSRVVVDLSGRPASVIDLQLARETIGGVACENFSHFFSSFATALRAAIHVDVLRGANDHHRIEASFKALGRALREAKRKTSSPDVPSLKGVLL
jgi:imidazoleglycerol phosphate dehydratase HisB